MSPVGPYRVKVSRRCPPDVVYVRLDAGPDIDAEVLVAGWLFQQANDKWDVIAANYARMLPQVAALIALH